MVLGRKRGEADEGPDPTEALLKACERSRRTPGISAVECDRFSDMVTTAIGANVMASDAQRAAARRDVTPAETAAGTILVLTIGDYAQMLAAGRITIEAFHQAVAMSLAIAARFDGYPSQ
jgi:hypothetical protein